MEHSIKPLPLVKPAGSHDGGCGCGAHSDSSESGGCGCGHGSSGSTEHSHTEHSHTEHCHTEHSHVASLHNTPTPGINIEESNMTTQTYFVTGMTCGHCVHAVTSELKALDGVGDVEVDLVAGGTSTVRVTSSQPLEDARVAAALDEAGEYQLA